MLYIREHIELHVPGLHYDCPDSSASFKSKINMRTHMLRTCPNKKLVSHNPEKLQKHTERVINRWGEPKRN